jgi:alkylated DNA repair protein alkB family protein 1
MEDAAIDADLEVLDFARGLTDVQKERLVAVDTVSSELIESAWRAFKSEGKQDVIDNGDLHKLPESCTIYEHKDFPGTTPAMPIMCALT